MSLSLKFNLRIETMKMIERFHYILIALTLVLFACNSDDVVDCSLSIENVISQMEENSLLKSIVQEGEKYHLEFEQGSMDIPAEQIQDYVVSDSLWKTTISFVNGRTLTVASLGKNIDCFIKDAVVNPSQYNPLSAEIHLELPSLGKMKVIIHTKDGNKEPDVQYSFKSVERTQRVLVLGLYPDYDNHVTLIYTDKAGNERARSEMTFKTELKESLHLPDAINITTLKSDDYEPGMTLVNSWGADMVDTAVPYMIDRDGEIRWVLDWDNHPLLAHCRIDCGLTRLADGNYLSGDATTDLLLEIDVLGNIVKQWSLKDLGYNFHHCATPTDDGHVMATVTKIDAKLADHSNSREQDVVVEFDPLEGRVVKEFDFANMLDSARYDLNGASDNRFPSSQTKSNWMHNNGILKVGDYYLGTARYQGVFKFNNNHDVLWVISAHGYWRNQFEKLLLQPLHADGTPITDPEVISGHKKCEDFEWPWGCHCCVQLPNGNYLVFDNGYGRQYKAISPTYIPFSRAVEYEVDEGRRTVRQVWQYGTERYREFFTPLGSSVQYLPETGNRLVGSADYNVLSNGKPGARVCEVDPKTNKLVYEAELVNGNFHRVLRMPLYPEGL